MEIVDPRTKAGYVLDREDDFAGPELDRGLWLPHHLPQWSSRAQSAARYRFDGGALRLVVEDDQPPWCPEFDGGTRVSSLQTGVFAGPVGSGVGQHRFTADAVVREAQASGGSTRRSTASSSCGRRSRTTRAAWRRSG